MSLKHINKYKSIGLKIAAQRKKLGLTQEQLADKVHISDSYITKIEAPNVSQSFSLEVLFDIVDALNIDIKDLL